MEIRIAKLCDRLCSILQTQIIMEDYEVAEKLHINEYLARKIIRQMREDKMAGGVGRDAVSRNNNTLATPDFYKQKIRESRFKQFGRFSDIIVKWLALILSIISILMQLQ